MQELEAFQGEYIPIQADLSLSDGYKKIASNIFTIDAIIHNSGISQYGMLIDLDEKAAQDLINIHVTTPLMLTKELLPKMTAKNMGILLLFLRFGGKQAHHVKSHIQQ